MRCTDSGAARRASASSTRWRKKSASSGRGHSRALPQRHRVQLGRLAEGRSPKIADEVLADVAHVVFRAMDEARFAPTHEIEAERVHAGRVDDAAVVSETTLAIEYRHAQP